LSHNVVTDSNELSEYTVCAPSPDGLMDFDASQAFGGMKYIELSNEMGVRLLKVLYRQTNFKAMSHCFRVWKPAHIKKCVLCADGINRNVEELLRLHRVLYSSGVSNHGVLSYF